MDALNRFGDIVPDDDDELNLSTIDEIAEHIEANGGVTLSDVPALEAVKPGIVFDNYPVGGLTHEPDPVFGKLVMESLDKYKAVLIGGGILALLALLIKYLTGDKSSGGSSGGWSPKVSSDELREDINAVNHGVNELDHLSHAIGEHSHEAIVEAVNQVSHTGFEVPENQITHVTVKDTGPRLPVVVERSPREVTRDMALMLMRSLKLPDHEIEKQQKACENLTTVKDLFSSGLVKNWVIISVSRRCIFNLFFGHDPMGRIHRIRAFSEGVHRTIHEHVKIVEQNLYLAEHVLKNPMETANAFVTETPIHAVCIQLLSGIKSDSLGRQIENNLLEPTSSLPMVMREVTYLFKEYFSIDSHSDRDMIEAFETVSKHCEEANQAFQSLGEVVEAVTGYGQSSGYKNAEKYSQLVKDIQEQLDRQHLSDRRRAQLNTAMTAIKQDNHALESLIRAYLIAVHGLSRMGKTFHGFHEIVDNEVKKYEHFLNVIESGARS